MFKKYANSLRGLKIRFSKGITDSVDALDRTIDLAERLQCPIMVHPTNPPVATEKILDRLRKNDVFTHVYHGVGNTIISNGKIKTEVYKARQRGVVFDAANGKTNFSFQVALPAINEKFYPDIISTDLTPMNLYKQPAFGMPYIMSKYLALGMPLKEVIAASTSNPAACLKCSQDFGTLIPGMCADVAVFKLKNMKIVYKDINDASFEGSSMLVPQMTIKSGNIVYKAYDFAVD